MSEFWSQWVIIFLMLTLVSCYGLGWWFGAINVDERWDDEHHISYQRWGELRAANHPVPSYWSFMFYLSAIGAGFYLILYPGLGNLPGKLNWTATRQYEIEHTQYTTLYIEKFNQYFRQSVPELAKDAAALKIGKRLFSAYCSNCHNNPGGNLQAPNLTDQDWLWGGNPEKIEETITKGRTGVMPGWETILGTTGINELTNYVMTLAGRNPIDPTLVSAGREKFARYCYFCHGRNGHGGRGGALRGRGGG